LSDIISELGVTPIPGQFPAGVNLLELTESEPTLAEVAKLNAMDLGPDAVNWQIVDSDVQGLLAKHGKHFQFAAYLAVARCQIDGIVGIAQGANLLKGLTENFWQDAYPPKKRVRGRINAIQWWLDWTNSWAEKFVQLGSEVSAIDIQNATDAIQNLECALVAEYDDAPVMRGLLNHLNRIPLLEDSAGKTDIESNDPAASCVSVVAKVEAESSETTSPTPQTLVTEEIESADTVSDIGPEDTSKELSSKQLSEPQQGFNATLSSDRGAEGCGAKELLASGIDLLTACAEKEFTEDAKGALSYRLRRIAAWSNLSQIPPNDGVSTKVSPPSRQSMTVLKSAKETNESLIWLRACELKVANNPYWLDLSYDSWQILESLGTEYDKAKLEIEQACAALVSRLPDITFLKFSDGTPFANAATQDWLAKLQEPQGEQEIDHIAEQESKANQLVADNKLEQAVGLLQKCLVGETHQNQFRLKIKMAKLLRLSGCAQLALTQLASCVEQIEQYRLDLWFPKLALEAYKISYECRLSLNQVEAAEQALNQIHLIDPTIAIRYFKAAQ